MPRYENEKDREQQGLALFSLQRHMQKLCMGPVRFNETGFEEAMPYDAQMWVHGKYVAVVEVKSINYSGNDVERWGHLMLKKSQLSSQRHKFCRRSDISGNFYWIKQVLILVRCIKDDRAWAINIEDVMRVWDESEIVPPEFCANDHGNEPSDSEHRYIKLQHWEPIV